ncbi:MAG TPA: ABC transporter permease subunit [Anaerolineae bacterium]|nr:ABC transporter permease subunit [Anaerolineae bacterium]
MTTTSAPKTASKRTSKLSGIFLFIGQQLLLSSVVLLAIIYLTFLGLEMARGTTLAPASAEALSTSLEYLSRLAVGDLGLTQAGSNTLNPRPVSEVLAELVPRSFVLLGLSLFFASFVGITLGLLAARKPERSLRILLLSIIGISVPSFFAAFLLQWFIIEFNQLSSTRIPVGGFGWDSHLLLPVLVLAARPIAQITRMTFVAVTEARQQDFMRTALSKGLRRYQILWIHIMRNAAIPILTTIGISLRFSLSSLPIVELFFGWPGMGFTLVRSIAQQDDNLTVILALCLGALFMLINILLEATYRWLDPRLREKPTHITANRSQFSLTVVSQEIAAIIERWRHWRPSLPQISWGRDEETSNASSEAGDLLVQHRASIWTIGWRNFPLWAGLLMVIGLVLIVFWGPNWSPHNPYTTQGLTIVDGELTAPPFPPNNIYPWGTDALGRDMMSLILTGAQQTIGLAVLVVITRMILGVCLGALSGWYAGRWLDRLIISAAEVIAAIPALLLAMIFILAIGIRQGSQPFIIALAFVGWGEIMQFVRGEVLAIRPKPFIEGAVATGATTFRLVYRHVLPNIVPALISMLALEFGAVLMLLGELGFINIFIGGGAFAELEIWGALYHYSDVPEWASLLSNIRLYARSHYWMALYPCLAFFVAILSFNLLGEGLRRLADEGYLVVSRLVNRYTVAFLIIVVVGGQWVRQNSGASVFYKNGAELFDGERAMAHVEALTAAEFDGRNLGTDGLALTADYIANEFKALGLQPAGERQTYFQKRFRAFETLTGIPAMSINDGGAELTYQVDFAPYPGRYASLGEIESTIRLVGLGQPMAGSGFRRGFSDLRNVDWENEIIMVLSEQDAFNVTRFTSPGGLLVVTEDSELLEQQFTLSGRSSIEINTFTGSTEEGGEVPSLWISRETAERILANAGYTLADRQDAFAELLDEEVWAEELPISAKLSVPGEITRRGEVQHIIGHLPGTAGTPGETQLDNKMIVVLAQYDAPPPLPNNKQYLGANNNASGIAVMLETIRVIQTADYEPYRTFLFVAYSGEGLEGGEDVSDPDIQKFLQAKIGFATAFDIEAIVHLRGLGGGAGDHVQVSAGGSQRLADLFITSANQMGSNASRADETLDISVIFRSGAPSASGQEAPELRVFWEGWSEHSLRSTDTIDHISADNLQTSGRALSMTLLKIGRELQY